MKVRLLTAMRSTKYRNCYGFIFRFSNGKYGYQNDNDLGLDLDAIDVVVNAKKVKCGKGYALLIRNKRNFTPEDDGTGISRNLAIALLHECHAFCDKLTEKEEKIVKKYWSAF